jgi:hypothetical protein
VRYCVSLCSGQAKAAGSEPKTVKI